MPQPTFMYPMSYPDIKYNGPMETFYKNIEPYEKLQTDFLKRDEMRSAIAYREGQAARDTERLGIEQADLGIRQEKAGQEATKFEQEQARDADYKAAAAGGGSQAQILGRMMQVSLKYGNAQEYQILSTGMGKLADQAELDGDAQTAADIRATMQGLATNPASVELLKKKIALNEDLRRVPLEQLKNERERIAESRRQHGMTFRASQIREDRAEAKAAHAEWKQNVDGATSYLRSVAKTYGDSLQQEQEADKMERRAKLAEASKGKSSVYLAQMLAAQGLTLSAQEQAAIPVDSTPEDKAAILRAMAEDARNKARALSKTAAEQMDEARNLFPDEQMLGEAALKIPEKFLPSTLVQRRAPRTDFGAIQVSRGAGPMIQRGGGYPSAPVGYAPQPTGATPGMPGYVRPAGFQAASPQVAAPVVQPRGQPGVGIQTPDIVAPGIAATLAGSGVPLTNPPNQARTIPAKFQGLTTSRAAAPVQAAPAPSSWGESVMDSMGAPPPVQAAPVPAPVRVAPTVTAYPPVVGAPVAEQVSPLLKIGGQDKTLGDYEVPAAKILGRQLSQYEREALAFAIFEQGTVPDPQTTEFRYWLESKFFPNLDALIEHGVSPEVESARRMPAVLGEGAYRGAVALKEGLREGMQRSPTRGMPRGQGRQ